MPRRRPRSRTIDVNVSRVEPKGPCDFEFGIDENDLKFKNDENNDPRPGFIIYFDIDEPRGVDCQFYAADPMWVMPINELSAGICAKLGTGPCPTSPCHWDQFYTIGLINNNKTLIVRNRNDYEQMFAFTLRLQVDGCRRVFELDPIGSNQNGDQ